MLRKERVLLAALLIAAISPPAAQAQFGRNYLEYMAMQGGGRPAVSATGVVVVKRNPTRMRMYIQLFGKGKTPEEALAKLKERREAATLQLESLKADKKSIVFGKTSFSTVQEAQKQRFEAMVREQMRAGGKAPKGLKVPQTTTVTTFLSAEWPLEATSQETLLLLAHGIEEKIKAADLSGGKEAEKLSPEEEELAEEARQTISRYGEQQQPLGQPFFLFVAEIDKPDRQKAMAEAFAKAKTQATDLAKAAGVELGQLIGLGGGCSGDNSFGEQRYNSYSNRGILSEVQEMATEGNEDSDQKRYEALSTTPGPLAFKCYLTATFALAK